MKDYILWFKEVDKGDVNLVGGKGANLGEMVKAKIPVPNGFIVSAKAYDHFIKTAGIREKINLFLKQLNVDDVNQLKYVAGSIQKLILSKPLPEDLTRLIKKSYNQLIKKNSPFVAIRSSATAEDLPSASFAGQQETFLNIRGEEEVCRAVQKAWASLFEERAIFYREQSNFDHFKVKIAVPIQSMIQSEISGVMFTIDPITGNKDKIIIEAIYGLGELIVQGIVTPDHYEVSKSDFTILKKEIEQQKKQLVKTGSLNKILSVAKSWQQRQKLDDDELKKLAKIGLEIEKHYFFPQDIEWGIEKNKIYILQTRPVTTLDASDQFKINIPKKIDLPVIISGSPASPGIASGVANVIAGASQISKVKKGEVLVAPMTNPDFVPAMKKAVAVVTDKGGRTSHAAIVSRELGIPAVVGTGSATKELKAGFVVTVNGSSGEIYKGGLRLSSKVITPKEKIQMTTPITTATKVYVNLAEPELAARIAARKVDGVGLLRAEFMIAQIGIHPKKIIKDKKQNMFINKLAEEVATICREFYPRPVIYRATDFKTNEYKNLTGGDLYEPVEANPMIGFRGVYRYIVDKTSFQMELEMIKKVRNKMKLKNLWLMLPFVRTVKELTEVKKIIANANLFRSESFKLWVMVEIPSNVIMLKNFIETGIDGISIGSNDLTMLTLGIDRDNEELAGSFDERDPAVVWSLETIVKTAQKYKITSSICGQSVSTYYDIVEKLVELGITSVSVNPDVIEQTRQLVAETEKRLVTKRLKNGQN